MNYDWSHFHKGHNRSVTGHGGASLINCLDCGVSADLEAVSAKVSPADACLLDAQAAQRVCCGQLSEGILFKGVK